MKKYETVICKYLFLSIIYGIGYRNYFIETYDVLQDLALLRNYIFRKKPRHINF